MSFHIEWERLAAQAYDMLDDQAQANIARAIVRLARQGIPDDAEPGQDGLWTLQVGRHIIVFTEHDLDVYLVAIEPA
ncbi:hypothetical protein ACIBH1_44615 [Nonomuraea sp. NPDC050663]|uniref:hypothetical protein n=1 Tax=Nonomuraea sp. NPDC050663 TaxID=3364370 RepID=UPI0037B1A550